MRATLVMMLSMLAGCNHDNYILFSCVTTSPQEKLDAKVLGVCTSGDWKYRYEHTSKLACETEMSNLSNQLPHRTFICKKQEF